jgi:uncharacterized protein (DUF488 family)
MIELYTIGFTQKTAERFFNLLKDNGVTMLVDIRLKPDSQLSGWAKRQDLPWFMRELVGGGYVHLPALCPTAEIMDIARAPKQPDRAEFERQYNRLLDERDIPNTLDRSLFEQHRCCLLCSEHHPDTCHRTFAANRIAASWPGVQIHHLM